MEGHDTLSAGGRPGDSPSGRVPAQERLGLDVLTITLGLSLWVAAGSLVLAIAEGHADHPARRVTIGVMLVAGYALALWRRRPVCAALQRRPWLVIVVAAVEVLAAVIDDPLQGAYIAVSLTSIGLAVAAARTATVWACVAVLVGVSGLAVFSTYSPSELADEQELGGVVSVLITYPVVALLLLTLRKLFRRFSDNADRIVLEIRAGAPVLTLALGQAVAQRGGPLLLDAGGTTPSGARQRLTPKEISVVEDLASGLAPKEIARRDTISLATVRTHIKHAKRKTGARTLRELAAMAATSDWPGRGAP